MVRQQVIKFCDWCNAMFAQTRDTGRPQRFCCKPCKLAHASAHRWDGRPVAMGLCPICGTQAHRVNGVALCSDGCRHEHHKAKKREWVQRTGFAARNYQRHKHAWRVHNARRQARLEVLTSPHTTEAKIEARMEYFGRLCWVCGAHGVERDHVKPLSKGWAHMPCNIRPICKHCNRSKKDAWPYMKNVRASATV